MANPEHLKLLKQGAKVWNGWILENEKEPDLSGADLRGASLEWSILLYADLSGADLRGANLHNTSLSYANLSGSDLRGAALLFANLTGSKIRGANLRAAQLMEANFIDADLRRAHLLKANLCCANLSGANLSGANLAGATIGGTVFANIDLREVKGLEKVDHLRPSEISVSTIYRSKGHIPEVFMRGCGLPESFIVQIPALVAALKPIQFYKSFISYSSKDQKFADSLYADLQNKGVRCWLASEDMKIGAKIRTGIDEAIRLHDKLLLVLSKNSVVSDWVEQEVETALERERKEKRLILYPIRLDETVMKIEGGWPALIRNTRNIGDFRKWKQHDSYQKAFNRLLRDLEAEEKHA